MGYNKKLSQQQNQELIVNMNKIPMMTFTNLILSLYPHQPRRTKSQQTITDLKGFEYQISEGHERARRNIIGMVAALVDLKLCISWTKNKQNFFVVF